MPRYRITQLDAYEALIERGPGRDADELRLALYGGQTHEQDAYSALRKLVDTGRATEDKSSGKAHYFPKENS